MTRHLQPTRRNRAATRASRPRLEALEDRSLPSTFTVLNLNDSGAGSLRAAIKSANDTAGADTILFDSSLLAAQVKQTIALQSELAITDDLTIKGPGADKLAVSGKGVTRVFHVSGAETDVAMSGLTITDGLTNTVTYPTWDPDYGPVTVGGGILNEGGRLSLSRMTFTNNRADGPDLNKDNSDGAGGAIANVWGGQLTVSYSTFTSNVASGLDYSGGGAIFSDGGKSFLGPDKQNYSGTRAAIDHCTFINNQATRSLSYSGGGALYDGTASEMTVSGCTFENNLALGGTVQQAHAGGGGYGGAIIAEPFGWFHDLTSASRTVLAVTDSTFNANGAVAGTGHGGWSAGGGAILADVYSEATISGCGFTGNRAVGRDDDSTKLVYAGIASGGAVANFGATLSVSSSTFDGNQAQGGSGGRGTPGGPGVGGALFTDAAPTSNGDVLSHTTVTGCQFTNNRAAGGVGDNFDPKNPDAAVFGGSGAGGAIANVIGALTVSNSQLVGNLAQGGAGANGKGGNADGGALTNVEGGTAVLTNVRIADNRAIGGAGGPGSQGGTAHGGGIFNGNAYGGVAATLTLTGDAAHGSVVTGNWAVGGVGGVGGNGGDGLGGGIFNGNTAGDLSLAPSLSIDHSGVTINYAVGGAAGSGGSSGQGIGGGVYNLGNLLVDVVSAIRRNKASTSNDDAFGL